MSFNIPKVLSETEESKNQKMTTVICVILVLFLFVMYNQKTYVDAPVDCHKHFAGGITEQVNSISVDLHNKSNQPVTGKYIILSNINRKNLPVKKVVAMAANRQLYPIDIKKAHKSSMAKGGTRLEFELAKEIPISQIILDVDIFCRSHFNLRTTQVEIRDADHRVRWSYRNLLPIGNRYIYLYVVKPKIVYDNKPQQVLCTDRVRDGRHGLGTPAYRVQDCNAELTLTDNLATNSWA